MKKSLHIALLFMLVSAANAQPLPFKNYTTSDSARLSDQLCIHFAFEPIKKCARKAPFGLSYILRAFVKGTKKFYGI